MAFKKGESGNIKGRPKGAIGRRTQLCKLFEPHAEKLIAKAVELALDGDVQAMRLCIERIVPKVRQDAIDIELPTEFDQNNLASIKDSVFRALLNGQLGATDAEKIIEMINEQSKSVSSTNFPALPDDPIEASKVYERIMRGT